MKKLIFLVAVVFGSSAASAFDFDPNTIVTGSNLTGSELGVVANTIAGDLKFRPVEGARAKPGPWTLSVGLMGGAMTAGQLKDAFPQNEIPPAVPELDMIIVAQITREFAGEFGFIPSIGVGDNKFSKFALGLKWTASRTFFGDRPPVQLAFRASYTKPSLFLVSGASQLEYSGSIVGGSATLGFGGGGFEPYIGLGYSSASGNLTGSGSANFFGTPISLTQAVPVSSSSFEIFGGLALQAGFFGLGLQAESSYGGLSGLLKISFQLGPFGGSEPRYDQNVAKRRQPQPATRAPASQPPEQQRQTQPAGQPGTQQRQQPRQQKSVEDLPPPPGY